MLQSIRDRTQGWIAGVVISLVILSFALWGVHSYMEGSANSTAVAKVNGVEISKNELMSAYDRLKRQAQTNIGTMLSEQVQADLKQKALQALLDIQILKQAAVSENYNVSSQQTVAYLQGMSEFQVNGVFSVNRFNQLLATTPYNASAFLDLIKTSLLIDQPRLGITFSAFALPNEVSETVALINQDRQIEYVSLSKDMFLKQDLLVSDKEIADYYQAHQDEFKTPDSVRIDYIELSAQALMADQHPSEEALKSFYKDTLNSYMIPAQWNVQKIVIPVSAENAAANNSDSIKKADEVLASIKKGTDFDTLAKQYPERVIVGTASKTDNWLSLNQVPMELQKPLLTMTTAGSISPAINTPNGIYIVKVLAYKPAQTLSFEQAKSKVTEALSRQLAEQKFAEMREKLANAAFQYPDSLKNAASATGLSVKVSESFTKNQGSDDISKNAKVRAAAFSEDVFHSQNNSDVIETSADSAIVLRIKSLTPSTISPLELVKKSIRDVLLAKKADVAAENLASSIRKKLQSGLSLQQVSQENPSVKVSAPEWIGRYSNKVDAAILDAAFRMPKPVKDANKLFVTVKTATGYAVVAIMDIRAGNLASNHDHLEAFAEQMQSSEGNLEYQLFQQSLRDSASIKLY